MADHIVDPTEFVDTEFVLTDGTIMGKKVRPCPCCEKSYKVERIGEHVKKFHPAFWSALFTVETLQASIDNTTLVSCTIAEKDHDQNFLVCLACDSIRTTDRSHFKKNGKVHTDLHIEMCTKMIANKQGKEYVPKSKTDLLKLQEQLDKYRRMAATCQRDHADLGALICDKEEAERELLKIKIARIDLEDAMKKHVVKQKYAAQILSRVSSIIADAFQHIPGGPGGVKLADKLTRMAEEVRKGRAEIQE
jgi:hypothetical protein